MTTIHDLLRAWGRSRSISDPPNDYPSQAPFARLIARGTIGLPPLPDDEQQRVDAAVSAMRMRKPQHHAVICHAYIEQRGDSSIGRKMRRSRHWVKETRIAAEHYLEAKLE